MKKQFESLSIRRFSRKIKLNKKTIMGIVLILSVFVDIFVRWKNPNDPLYLSFVKFILYEAIFILTPLVLSILFYRYLLKNTNLRDYKNTCVAVAFSPLFMSYVIRIISNESLTWVLYVTFYLISIPSILFILFPLELSRKCKIGFGENIFYIRNKNEIYKKTSELHKSLFKILIIIFLISILLEAIIDFTGSYTFLAFTALFITKSKNENRDIIEWLTCVVINEKESRVEQYYFIILFVSYLVYFSAMLYFFLIDACFLCWGIGNMRTNIDNLFEWDNLVTFSELSVYSVILIVLYKIISSQISRKNETTLPHVNILILSLSFQQFIQSFSFYRSSSLFPVDKYYWIPDYNQLNLLTRILAVISLILIFLSFKIWKKTLYLGRNERRKYLTIFTIYLIYYYSLPLIYKYNVSYKEILIEGILGTIAILLVFSQHRSLKIIWSGQFVSKSKIVTYQITNVLLFIAGVGLLFSISYERSHELYLTIRNQFLLTLSSIFIFYWIFSMVGYYIEMWGFSLKEARLYQKKIMLDELKRIFTKKVGFNRKYTKEIVYDENNNQYTFHCFIKKFFFGRKKNVISYVYYDGTDDDSIINIVNRTLNSDKFDRIRIISDNNFSKNFLEKIKTSIPTETLTGLLLVDTKMNKVIFFEQMKNSMRDFALEAIWEEIFYEKMTYISFENYINLFLQSKIDQPIIVNP